MKYLGFFQRHASDGIGTSEKKPKTNNCEQFIMHPTRAEREEARDVFVAERESAVCV